ncbi:MAG: S1 RNA-binding domain-containing protein [Tissierellia bacterium]|nr:S1 RNA-binding domain-containing protein [Tissierellia bacterium]
MDLAVGTILEGTVSGITNFGAFVKLPENKSGLVHISEIAEEYVENIDDYLKKGDKVKVKVLSATDDGKISLSIKQAKPKTKKPAELDWSDDKSQTNLSFEDKLSKFLKESNERMDDVRLRDNRKGAGGRQTRFNNMD